LKEFAGKERIMADETMVSTPQEIEADLLQDRTDTEVFGSIPSIVMFGDRVREDGSPGVENEDWREYKILSAKRNRGGRKFRQELEKFGPTTNRVLNMIDDAMKKDGKTKVQIADIVNLFFLFVGEELDKVIDLIYVYCPNLAEDREWIENHGDDDQFFHAIITVFKVSFGPFGRVLGLNFDDITQGYRADFDRQVNGFMSSTDVIAKPEDTVHSSKNGAIPRRNRRAPDRRTVQSDNRSALNDVC